MPRFTPSVPAYRPSALRHRWIYFIGLLLSVSWVIVGEGTSAASVDPATAEAEGRALATQLIGTGQKPPEDFAANGLLTIRPRSGKRTEFPVKFNLLVHPSDWRVTYEVHSDNPPVNEKLTVVHFDNGQPNQYWLTRADSPTNHSAEPASILGEQTMIPYAGSDFWLFDLGLEFFYWPDQRLVKREMRRGRSCRVLESRNPQPSSGGYSRILSWIDGETSSLIRAEAYDDQNRMLKEFHPGALAKINGRVQLKEMEIRNILTGSRTQIEFNFE